MKLNYICLRPIIFTLLLIFCLQLSDFAQEFESGKGNKPGFFYGFSIGPSKTMILNSGSAYDALLVTTKENSMFGSAEIGYLFSDYFGLSTGIGYISFKSKLRLNSYQKSFSAIDSENESFEMRVSGSGIQELERVDFISLPFCAHFRLPFNQTFGLFLKAGINLSLPVNKKYSSSGTFTYKGYYPKYNVLLENLPAYGLVSDRKIVSNGELGVYNMHVNTFLSTGLDVKITNSVQFGIGVNFNNIILKESYVSSQVNLSPGTFQLTPDANKINSFMQGSRKAVAQSVETELTLRFFLN